jgi:hypothetical protein
MGIADREQVSALQARRIQALLKDSRNECIFPSLSAALEFKVALQHNAIGVEFTDEPPIFAKGIHPIKGRGLPSTLTATASPEKGPYLVAIDGIAADGLSRKEVLTMLRRLSRPVILTFRERPDRLEDRITKMGASNYSKVLGSRASMLSEMYKRDHPDQYYKGPGGWVASH